MMFSTPAKAYLDDKGAADALDLFLLLHADHEQNCSTSTVRMVPLVAPTYLPPSQPESMLFGALHGGANMAVIQMGRNSSLGR